MLSKKLVVLILVMVFALTMLVSAEEEVDFGGKEITIICNWEYLDPNGEQAKEIMAKYNIGGINMLTTPWEEIYNTAKSRLLSGDSTYDIWYLGHTFPHPLLKDNALYPVSDILGMDYYESLPPVKKMVADVMTLDQDKRYYVADFGSDFFNYIYVYWNKDLFERQGLPDLYELYQAGEWTYEKMEEIAKKATLDKDNDGTIDQWGIGRIHHKDWMLSNGGSYLEWEDSQLKVAMGDDVIYALSVLSKWKNVDKILKSANYEDDETIMNLFFEGNAAMTTAAPWELWPDAMEDRYSVVPLPKGPDTDEHSFYQMSASGYYLPLNSAEPEKMIKFIQEISPRDQYEYIVQGTIPDIVIDEESAMVLMESVQNPNDHSFYEAIFGSEETNFWQVLDDIVAGKKSASTAIDEIKPSVQASVDEYNKVINK